MTDMEKSIVCEKTDGKSIQDLNLPSELSGSWGAEEAIAEDIIVPKLLLMHGQSSFVLEGEKSQGDLVRSTDRMTLGGRDKTVKIIPFKMFKTWRICELVDGVYEYRNDTPYFNADLPWEFEAENRFGKVAKFRRDKAYNFYALLADEVADDSTAFPIKLQFLRSSIRAGKTLADHFSKCRMINKPPAIGVFEIGSEFVNGDKHKYFIFTAKYSGPSTMSQLKACKFWFDLMQNTNVNVKDHEVLNDKIIENTETSNNLDDLVF